MGQSPQVLVFPPVLAIYFCGCLEVIKGFIKGFLSVIQMTGFAKRLLPVNENILTSATLSLFTWRVQSKTDWKVCKI